MAHRKKFDKLMLADFINFYTAWKTLPSWVSCIRLVRCVYMTYHNPLWNQNIKKKISQNLEFSFRQNFLNLICLLASHHNAARIDNVNTSIIVGYGLFWFNPPPPPTPQPPTPTPTQPQPHLRPHPHPHPPTYTRQWIGSTWIQIMACRLFGA